MMLKIGGQSKPCCATSIFSRVEFQQVNLELHWGGTGLIGLIRLNVPPNTLQVILGTGFYGSNDPSNMSKH